MARRVKVANTEEHPVTYSRALALAILDRVAGGEALDDICSEPGMPPSVTVRRWVYEDKDGLGIEFLRAKQLSAEKLADQLLKIADAPPPRLATGAIDYGSVHLARLQIETRKWLLTKLLPRMYGDKVQVSGDPDGASIKISDTDRAARIDAILRAAEARLLEVAEEPKKIEAKVLRTEETPDAS